MTTSTWANNPAEEQASSTPPPATIGSRAVAYLIDRTILAIIVTLLAVAAAYVSDIAMESREAVTVFLGITAMFSTIFEVVYFSAFFAISGQTPGKYVMKIRVVSSFTGREPGIARSIFRAFGYLISSFFLYFGFLWALWDPRRQTWHDKLAGTVVVEA